MSNVYKVTDGIVTRHGKPVAKVHEETVEYLDDDAKNYRLPIAQCVRKYREENGPPTSDELPEHLRPVHEVFPDAPQVWSGRGDKDPTLVQWLKTNHPEFYAKRYNRRKTGVGVDNSGKTITRQCVEAQRQAALDFRSRRPADAKRNGYTDQRVIREYIGAYTRIAAGGF